mgnify:CR=1 FL=1
MLSSLASAAVRYLFGIGIGFGIGFGLALFDGDSIDYGRVRVRVRVRSVVILETNVPKFAPTNFGWRELIVARRCQRGIQGLELRLECHRKGAVQVGHWVRVRGIGLGHLVRVRVRVTARHAWMLRAEHQDQSRPSIAPA